jgi:very-short-patch-repair endonuclease
MLRLAFPKPAARNPLTLAAHARRMRLCPTRTEERLHRALAQAGLVRCFRRQVPLAGRYIVDLLAPAARLVVEVDGGYHERCGAADSRRDERLARLGYRVLRLEAGLVEQHLEEAVAQVAAALAASARQA